VGVNPANLLPAGPLRVRRQKAWNPMYLIDFDGGRTRARTVDLLIKSRVPWYLSG
jgi:hypothetical protein